MKAFKRIFSYVWPQWPRVIVVVLSAIVVSSLLSLSFVTVIPLLKVMMGQEGLHGWVNRKVCSQRYGISFFVPEKIDFTEPDVAFHLLVTDVEEGGAAEQAGIKKRDEIVGAGVLLREEGRKIPSGKLLEHLANSPGKTDVTVQIVRDGGPVTQTLRTPAPPFYLGRLKGLMTFVPAEQTRENKTKTVTFIILALGVVTMIRCLAKFYQSYLAEKVVQVGVNHIREDAFSHVTQMPVGFFANDRPSDVVSRLVRDTSVMGKSIKIMLGKALREPMNVLFMMIAAFWLNWQLTLIFLCGAPFVLGLVGVFGKKMKRATRKSLVVSAQMLVKLQETVAGLKVVKIYNRQDYEQKTFKGINNRLLRQLLKISKVDAATTPTMEVLGMMAGSAALIVGAHWTVRESNPIDGTEFLGLLILLGAAAEAARKTSDIWNKIQEANAASERVFSVMDEPLEHQAPGAFELAPLKNRIDFVDVFFTYPGSQNPVLKGVNLSVEAGHNVAIVGPNGSGKTTLANLIPRFHDPDSGKILIDGQDIREATLFSLRDQIGMVTQNMVTFNDTIAANIAYGKAGATREEIVAAAKGSFAHEFIDPLPDGYETVIGEQGVGLSGGQLQRIVIARAIVKNPAILIFDEATSQIDADSEAKIHAAIEQIMRDRTSIIIAHRFSTVVSADVIVVMDEGGIVAQGQHENLMQSCPLYQSLYEIQLVKT
ncbi:MAG: ATP-binding cassette domain-containing protein [Phycisphaerales bacterium]|nr:MAG: ATP-binding cassette domain-containing protein [Phycisphaerales bacterium]